MTRFATALRALDSVERDGIVFSVANDLAPDETIDDAVFEVRPLSGQRDLQAVDGDERIRRIVEGEWQDDDADDIVLQRVVVKDRPAGNTYNSRCTATTSLDRKSERDRRETGGFPYLDKTIDSDARSVQPIALAVQAAQAAQSQSMVRD